jgi:hypothetical protein
MQRECLLGRLDQSRYIRVLVVWFFQLGEHQLRRGLDESLGAGDRDARIGVGG